MHGAGGINPMVQGDINANTRANINLGTQVNIAVAKRENWDTAISHGVQVALDKALSLQNGSVDLSLGDGNHLVKIRDSLEEIRDFIVIAEGSPIKDRKLMELLEELKDAAYFAEDVLEEYEIADRRRSEKAENLVRAAVVTSVPKPEDLNKLSKRLEAIKKKGRTFQLERKVTKLQIEFKKQRETHSFVHKSHVFERAEEKEKIVNWLLSDQASDHENVSVISIVGIGGIGKTTLAKLVINQESVQDHFKPNMWVCVFDKFDVTGLLKEIIQRAKREEKNIQYGTDDNKPLPSSVEELQCLLREKLSGKRYLLVLDDVWNEEPEKWHRLRDLLLCGERGSRIVITTRSRKVASIMSKIHPHILKPLSEDGCWSLFCQRAFGKKPEEAEEAHPNLAPIGRDIVKKCGGIPLAVTTLGGLLYLEKSKPNWEFVRNSEMWNLADENEHGILPALRLSYYHLKPHLKQCFAFCGLFPQDYEIEKELVIKLWMAQGFIPTKRGMELEDIGNDIFNELVMRSFFQDVKENVTILKPREGYLGVRIPDRTTFRMHDLMHDLAHSVVVLNDKSKDIFPRIRHFSSNGLGILAASLHKAQMLRTYVMLEDADFQFPCDVGSFKYLRALDFMRQLDFVRPRDRQKVGKQLCTSLGKLQHLRYLDLSFTRIEMLPKSLPSLCFLQTLILIRCTELCELPKEMRRLTSLRCLDITDCWKLTHMPQKMGQLSCLQELSNFIVGRTNEIACSGIGELQGLNLRGRLKIQSLKNITDAIGVLQDTLINKPNLTSLDLQWNDDFTPVADMTSAGNLEEDKSIEVLENLKPHRNLKKLGIHEFGALNFPSWMMDTTRTELVEITLSSCWRYSHLPPLGELPFLKVLDIAGLKNVECIGNEFYGNEVYGGFPLLKELEIRNMQKLKTWSRLKWKGERVFPELVKLRISGCPMLTTVEFFPDIKDLNVDQGMMQNLKNQKSFESSMHQQNCNQSSFAEEDQIRSQSSLQYLEIHHCDKLIFSGLGLRYLSYLKSLEIESSNEFAHVAHELSFLTSLQVLSLNGCRGLKSLPEGIGNLTFLRDLYIFYCSEMASLPRELQRLSALKQLYIRGCPTLEIRCMKDTGDDWDKIQHIPEIRIGDNLIARD